jgi:flagellin-like hook-associated protein FlgL
MDRSDNTLIDTISDPSNTIQFHKYARTLYTHPGGQTNDGSISINVVNLEHVLQIGNLDTSNRPYWDSTNAVVTATGINLGDVENDQTALFVTDNGLTANGFIESIMAVSVGAFTNAIEKLADVRAENGAEQNRALQVTDLLRTNLTNLEAAHGRIMDADIALESTRFARQNVLVQAGAAMTAQANQLTNVALLARISRSIESHQRTDQRLRTN